MNVIGLLGGVCIRSPTVHVSFGFQSRSTDAPLSASSSFVAATSSLNAIQIDDDHFSAVFDGMF